MFIWTRQLALAATAAISLTACAENYAVEGAGAVMSYKAPRSELQRVRLAVISSTRTTVATVTTATDGWTMTAMVRVAILKTRDRFSDI